MAMQRLHGRVHAGVRFASLHGAVTACPFVAAMFLGSTQVARAEGWPGVAAWGEQRAVRRGPVEVVPVEIASKGGHALARTSDGGVVAWGDNNFGQTSPPSSLGAVIGIAAGY